jgi:hypothetical protein
MSATYFGGEVKYTKRYRLGQLLSTTTRHFLLMTATPHNGNEEDFQLFMALKRLLWCIHYSRRVPKEPCSIDFVRSSLGQLSFSSLSGP